MNQRFSNTLKLIITGVLLFHYLISAASTVEPDSSTYYKTQKRGTGFLITGISLSTIGAASLIYSGYLFHQSQHCAQNDDIGKGIYTTFGSVFAGAGVVFEVSSLFFYSYYGIIQKHNKKVTMDLSLSPYNIKILVYF